MVLLLGNLKVSSSLTVIPEHEVTLRSWRRTDLIENYVSNSSPNE